MLEGMSHSGRRDMQIVRDRRVVRGPGAIKTAIWTKPTATEPKVALDALDDLEAVDGAAAWA